MKNELKALCAYLLFLCGTLLCADVQSGTLSLGIGADYAQGKYGEPTTTKDYYVPFSVAYREGAWKGKVVIPFIAIQGNGEVVGGPASRLVDDRRSSNSGSGSSNSGSGSSGSGGGGQDDAQEAVEDATNTSTTRNSGLGDVLASVTYSLVANEENGTYIDVTGRVKFGAASDSKGLGTGENDYSFLVDVDKESGKWTLSVGAGYTVIGEPAGFNYRNVVSVTTGFSRRLEGPLSVNTYLTYRQSSRSGAPDQFEIAPGLSFRPDDHNRVDAYVLFGLKDGSPDLGVGIAYVRSF